MFRELAAMVFVFLIMSMAVAKESTPGVTDTEVVIGNHSVQTGPLGIYGVLERVTKAYFEMINEKGGVNGRKIKYLIEDSAANLQQSLQVTKKLVEKDHVLAIMGGHGFSHTSVYKYLRKEKVPDIWINDPTDIYTNPAYPTSFAFYPSYALEAKVMGEYMVKHYPGKKLGILKWDTLAGQESADAVTKATTGKLPLAAVEEFNAKAPNVNAQILNLKNKGVEVIYTPMFAPLIGAAVKFAREQKYYPKWFISFSNCNKPTVELIGKDNMDGIVSWNTVYGETDTDIPGVQEHLKFMKERLPNEKPSTLTVLGQAEGELMVETLKRAGRDLTRESLLKAAESFKDWKCSVCRAANSTGPDKHMLNTNVILLKVVDGKWVPVGDQ